MLRRRQKPGDLDLLLLCFAGFCILFFSTSRSKLPGYILPAIPAIGLLLARHWASQVQQKQTASRWIGAIGGVLLIGFGILFRYFGSHIHVATDVRPAQIVSYVSFLAVFGGMISLLATRSKHGHAAFMAMSVTMLAMMAVASGDLWQLDAGISARPAVSLARKDWPIEKLNTARVFGLRRDYVYSLQFYLHQEIPEWTPSDGNQEIIFTNFRGSEDLQKRGVLCPRYVVFPAVMICGAPMNRKAAER
jgi:4-amino-4-deoxy-L-arabinose transferase-like glycosyltransferase